MSVESKQNQALPVEQSKQEQPATRASSADYTIWCRDACVDINLSDPDEPRYTFFERVERNGQIEYSTSITDSRTYLDLVKVANVACDHFCKQGEWPNHEELSGLLSVGERRGPLPAFSGAEPTTPPTQTETRFRTFSLTPSESYFWEPLASFSGLEGQAIGSGLNLINSDGYGRGFWSRVNFSTLLQAGKNQAEKGFEAPNDLE